MKRTKAVGILCCVIALAPGRAEAQQTAADSAWDAGRHDVAERMYATRLSADSNDVMALRRIGTLRAWAGNYAESIALYNRAVKLAPNNVRLGLERARVLAWDRRYPPAIEAVDALLSLEPTNRELLEARAQFTSWSGRYDESLDAYGKLLEMTPQDAALRLAAARVMGWAKQYEAAVTEYNWLLVQKPGDRELTLGLAQVLLWGGKTDSAGVIFRNMLAANERDLDALKGLARGASWSGDLRNGELYWRRVGELAPNDIEAIIGLGAVLRWQGRDAAAIDLLRRAQQIDSTNADLRVQLPFAKAALAPRIGPAYTYEEDSDGNIIRTLNGALSFRVGAPLELRISGYHRSLQGPGLAGGLVEADAYGATGSLMGSLANGWTVSGVLGAGILGGSDADAITNVRAGVASPRWLPFTAALNYTRTPFDYTAVLALRRVHTEQVSLDGTVRLSARWNATATGAWTNFEGAQSNRQLSAASALTYRLRPSLTAGLSGRVFSFQKDRSELLDGYFNPDFYGIIEATANAYLERGHIVLSGDLAPGLQRIGSDGETSGSLRAAARIAYVLRPGRQIGISATYANSGLQQLSPIGDTEYTYKAFNLSTTWTF